MGQQGRFPESGHRKTWNLGPILRLHYVSLSHLGKQCSPTLSDARVLLTLFLRFSSVCFYTPTLGHARLWNECLQPFLELLQTYPQQRYTFEFRHQSWLIPQVYELLSNAGAVA